MSITVRDTGSDSGEQRTGTPAEMAEYASCLLPYDMGYLEALFEQIEVRGGRLSLGVGTKYANWQVSSDKRIVYLFTKRVPGRWTSTPLIGFDRHEVTLDEGLKIMAALTGDTEGSLLDLLDEDGEVVFSKLGVTYTMREVED